MLIEALGLAALWWVYQDALDWFDGWIDRALAHHAEHTAQGEGE